MPIGPALPPGFRNGSEEDGPIGPSLPRMASVSSSDPIGPSIGPTMGPSRPPPSRDANYLDDDFGPANPPVGPSRPNPPIGQSLGPSLALQSSHVESDSDDDFGPSLPPGFGPTVKGPTMPVGPPSEDEEDDFVIGPLPPIATTAEEEEDRILAEFERREERMKLKLSGVDVDGEHKIEREEWMTELPSLRQGNQVIGATTFRKNGVIAAESGRSEWTKTPNSATSNLNSKERRVEDGKRIQFLADLHKNERQEKELAKAKRDSESLMESHQRKMRKIEKEERKKPGYKKERVAFDREKDMQGSIIDDAKRKQLLKKTMALDNRFGAGHSKFL